MLLHTVVLVIVIRTDLMLWFVQPHHCLNYQSLFQLSLFYHFTALYVLFVPASYLFDILLHDTT